MADRDLNQEFYRAEPHRYFATRWQLLLLAAARKPELDALLASGVDYEGLAWREEESLLGEGDAVSALPHHLAYLTCESQSLLHHTAESLLRLFICHADDPAIPWVELSSLRSFSAFKEKADAIRGNRFPDLAAKVRHVLAMDHVSEGPELLDTAIEVLRLGAEVVLQDANLYNAVKHGNAVIGGESSIGFSGEEGQQVFGHSGTSVLFLERPTGEPWSLTTNWVSISRSMFLTSLFITQIESLWTVARARYLGERLHGVQFVMSEALDELADGHFKHPPIKRFAVKLDLNLPDV